MTLLILRLNLAIILIFISFSVSFGQCTDGNQPECACETAPVLCSVDELDGYMFSMSSFPHADDGPTPICNNDTNSQTDNPTWFAFTAWCTELTLEASFANCRPGTVGLFNILGVQIAIYGDCTFTEQLACNVSIQTCNTDNKILELSDLVIGNVYYFLVDGCLGSYCDVTIDILGVCGEEEIEDWTMPINGNENPCVNTTEEYFAEELLGAAQYSWFLNGALINVSSSPILDFPWSTAGTFELCIDASNDPCVPLSDEPPPLCITINVQRPDAGDLIVSPMMLCTNELVDFTSIDYNDDVNTRQLILLTNESGDIIDIIESDSGTFTSPVSATYTIYAYNFVIGADLFPSIGDNINTINCNFLCCDLEQIDVVFENLLATVSNIICDDNGTGNNLADDLFYFDILVSGSNSVSGWELIDNPNITGDFNTLQTLGPFPIIDGEVNFTLQDINTSICLLPITILPPAPCSMCSGSIGIEPISENLTCSNTSIELTGIASGDGIYHWEGPNGYSEFALTGIVNVPGWYYLSGEFANECLLSDSVFIAIDTMRPTANAGTDQIIDCIDTEATLMSLWPLGSEFESTWINPAGTVISNSESVEVTEAGVYTLLITDTTNGCTAMDEVQIEIDNIGPSTDARVDQIIDCINQSATLTSANITETNIEYEWINPNGIVVSEDPSVEVNTAGIYSLQLTNLDNGCITTSEVVVEVNITSPLANAGPNQTIDCANNSVTLLGESNSNNSLYQWTNPSGAIIGDTSTIDVNIAGIYILQITDPINGCTNTDEVIVDIDNTAPTANAGLDQYIDCINAAVTLDGSASIGNNLNYQWLEPNGNTIGNAATITVESIGVYTLVITENNNGCMTLDEVQVLVDNNTPSANAGFDQTIDCNNQEVTLDGLSSIGNTLEFLWSDTIGAEIGNTATINVNSAGSYQLQITNIENGCTATDEVLVDIDNTIPSVDAGPDQTIDCVTTEAILDGGFSSGENLTYEWLSQSGDYLSNSISISAEVAGVYTLQVTNIENGCAASDQVEVTLDLQVPTADAGENQKIDCNNLEVSIGDLTEPGNNIDYSWISPAGDLVGNLPSLLVSLPGMYTLLVTDTMNGCTSVDEVLVERNISKPNVIVGPNQTITCSNMEVILEVSATGAGDLNYEWRSPSGVVIDSTTTVVVSIAGTYTVHVTDLISGCSASDEVLVEIDNAIPTANAGADQTIDCYTEEVLLDGSASTGSNHSYQWFSPTGDALGNAASITVSQAGVYTLQIIDPQNGCSTFDEVLVIADNTNPIANAGFDQVLDCINTEVILDGSGSIGDNLVYEWFDSLGVSIHNTSNTQVSLEGIYTLQVTNPNNGCTAIEQVLVTLNTNEPMADAGPDMIINCISTEVQLHGAASIGNNLSYEWRDPSGAVIGSSSSVYTNAAGVYVLKVTDIENGCSNVDEVDVSLDNYLPIADAGSDQTINCISPTIMLSSELSIGSNLDYEWIDSTGEVISEDELVIVSNAGNYNLIVTDANNGCESIDGVEIFIDTIAPVSNAGVDQVLNCIVSEVLLDGSLSIGENLYYEWINSTGEIISNTIIHLVDTAGTYTLETTNSINGCTAYDDVIIDIDMTTPIANAGPDQTIDCNNPNVEINASASFGKNLEYIWYSPTGVILGNNTSMIVDISGEYKLVATNTDNGCSAEDIVEVLIDSAVPTANAGEDQIIGCDIEQIVLDGSTSIGNNLAFVWTNLNGEVISNSSTVLVNNAGLYNLQVIDSSNGCNASDQVIVSELLLPLGLGAIDIENENCLGDNDGSINVADFSSGTPPFIYSLNGEILNDVGIFSDLVPDEYLVQIIDANGCIIDTVLNVLAGDTFEVIMPDTLQIMDGRLASIVAVTSNPPSEIAQVSWSPSNILSCDTCLQTQYGGSEDQLLQLAVTDINGCIDIAEINIIVTPSLSIYVPNAFSPNGDGTNDNFTFYTNDQVALVNTFKVFDRWGAAVFELSNFDPTGLNFGWNGMFRDQTMNPGVFIYLIEFTTKDGDLELITGDVFLIK